MRTIDGRSDAGRLRLPGRWHPLRPGSGRVPSRADRRRRAEYRPTFPADSRADAGAAHKDAIKTLLRCCDEGVVARRDAFRAQFDAAPVEIIPALLFRTDVPYVSGRCFS